MRAQLLWNPQLLCERLALAGQRRRRMRLLRGTIAGQLSLGHIDSLELLEIAREMGIDAIFDIGANIGTWSMLARAVVPGASIDAFEPLGEHCKGFASNLAGQRGVALHEIALGRENGVGSLHLASFSDASSLLALTETGEKEFGIVEVGRVPITVRRLDEYVEERSLGLPDLIKLDVQGYELEVLAGAHLCLGNAKAVIIEVSFRPFYDAQSSFSEVCSFLGQRGFELHALSATTQLATPLAQTDALFKKL